ncbi:MAG: hypothetical protein NTU73_03180 [Ignavibacteriae bacterium]|nr:hypothetical protein [Ignavibacteriota bacterium]
MKARVIFVLLFIICSYFIIGCGASKDGSSIQKQWKHFRIDLISEESKEIINLQDDLEINPKLGKITVCVNITDEKLQMITIGDENDPTAMTFPWSTIRKSVQNYLLNYTGLKKIKL